jgi:hypothetical protein
MAKLTPDVYKITDIDDIETSIHDTLVNQQQMFVGSTAARFFWESLAELKSWANLRGADVESVDAGPEFDNNGYLISVTKENII